MAKQQATADAGMPEGADDDTGNPLSNSTEEKPASCSSISIAEEFLHDSHKEEYLFSVITSFYKCENADTYTAFHGELLVPPPNQA